MYLLIVELNSEGHPPYVRGIEDGYFRSTMSPELSSTLQEHQWRGAGVGPLDTAVSIGD